MTELGDIPGGDNQTSATDVSADGSTVVGNRSTDLPHGEIVIWRNGIATGLGIVGGGLSDPSVSADGSVVAGTTISAETGTAIAFRWEDGEVKEASAGAEVLSISGEPFGCGDYGDASRMPLR